MPFRRAPNCATGPSIPRPAMVPQQSSVRNRPPAGGECKRRVSTIGTMNRFCAYELRTMDVERARAFYNAIFGPSFFSGGIRIAPLPAAAIARGAAAHWLGHIGVDDVSATTDRFI